MSAEAVFESISRLWKTAFGETRFAKNTFQCQRAAAHVGGVFQQPHVARHQCGCGEAHYLPEREIPGHHGQHRPERIEAHVTGRFGIRRVRLRADEGLAVVGVVGAAERAFLNLAPALAPGFCPFRR